MVRLWHPIRVWSGLLWTRRLRAAQPGVLDAGDLRNSCGLFFWNPGWPMELRDYFVIARRWWWLIVLPALVAGIYGAATYHRPTLSYSASMRYTASQPATLANRPGYYPNYYRWLTPEYLVLALKTT